ncbi:MAG: ABC transporter ATP-binding protein [Candidatus Tectimicrobiota bacterium]
MATVTLEHLSKSFGSIPAVQDVSLTIAQGEFLALLGPSGCGKTTTLFMLAGIYRPSSGALRFDGRLVNDLPPRQRNIGMVFQNYALYPHLTVYENLAFPLRLQRAGRATIQRKVTDMATLVQLGDVLERKPAQLSGGQQQRVALGRALIKEPDLLLFDEPLSNLDAELRLHMRAEIKRLQRTLGITAVLVTHDQIEALSMADRILVLRGGQVQQLADPHTLYYHPANQFVARFIGSTPMNFFPLAIVPASRHLQLMDTPHTLRCLPALWARLTAARLCACGPLAGAHAPTCTPQFLLGIRPEDLRLQQQPGPSSLPVTLSLLEPLGRDVLATVSCQGHGAKVVLPAPCPFAPETSLWLDLSQGPYHCFDIQSGAACV